MRECDASLQRIPPLHPLRIYLWSVVFDKCQPKVGKVFPLFIFHFTFYTVSPAILHRFALCADLESFDVLQYGLFQRPATNPGRPFRKSYKYQSLCIVRSICAILESICIKSLLRMFHIRFLYITIEKLPTVIHNKSVRFKWACHIMNFWNLI